MSSTDAIVLADIPLAVRIGRDVWLRDRDQHVLVTVHASLSLADAAVSDDVADTVHYGHLGSAISVLSTRQFESLLDLAENIATAVFLNDEFRPITQIRVEASAPKLLLHAESLHVDITCQREPDSDSDSTRRDVVQIKNLTLPIIIGVNPPERLYTQRVFTTVAFYLDPPPRPIFPHHETEQALVKHIQGTSFQTLEAFASSVANVAFQLYQNFSGVSVQAQKPSAVSFGHSSSVQITRNRAFFQKSL
ncbi:hypothetical protein M422DRAFT_239978 [Sphaerobolus stellatus SS14]|nr:hypothetical protein M422DRAFT_239978 [Sphaerobolus stellatus SS14]